VFWGEGPAQNLDFQSASALEYNVAISRGGGKSLKGCNLMSMRHFFCCGLIGLCLSSVSVTSVNAQEKKPTDVYNMVQHLNEGLVNLLRRSHGSNIALTIDRRLIGAEYQPRHVFQKALDIELKLLKLMQVNGVRIETTKRLAIQPYSPDQVFALINGLHKKVDSLLLSHGMKVHAEQKKNQKKEPENVYHLLERMDRFLLKMGAPSSQPGHVLRRAQAIAFLAEKLCKQPVCTKISRHVPAQTDHIIPMNVYLETYRFITSLDHYVTTKKVPLKGGVLALPIHNGMITPAQVNDLMGVALADMIEVTQLRTNLRAVDLQDINLNAMPRDVWVEINYARRLLDIMTDRT
jgi:hypothetical protein